MNTPNQHLEALKDIKQMMERSSRFISLSGLSGIAAGCCGLIGAYLAKESLSTLVHFERTTNYAAGGSEQTFDFKELVDAGILKSSMRYMVIQERLIWIAAITFSVALILAFLFTYLRSKKQGIAIWGKSSQRLMFNVCIPMIAGGFMVLKLLQIGRIGLIAPTCLIFYGLALIHGSKYTLGEVRYLGYGQLLLGIVSLWFIGYGLYFWAAGFGVLHILYGAIMWWKYERN